MTQQTLPFIEGKYGWALGESNWNLGMDENLVKFSFMFDRNIDGIVGVLPTAVSGEAYFLTTDKRLYFAANNTWYSSPTPKWFIVTLRTTAQLYQFNGVSLSVVSSPADVDSRLDAVEVTIDSLGTAAFADVSALNGYTDAQIVLSKYKTLRPEQYGAPGTVGVGNATVDTAAWLAVCAAMQSGYRLEARGTYLITGSAVTIPTCSNIVLDLRGAVFTQQSNFSRTLVINGVTGLTILGGTFHGRGGAAGEYNGASSSYNGVAAIYIYGGDLVTVDGLVGRNHAGGCLVMFGVPRKTVKNCDIKGIGSSYIDPIGQGNQGNGSDFAIMCQPIDNSLGWIYEDTFVNNKVCDHAFGIQTILTKTLHMRGNIIGPCPGQHGIYGIENDGINVVGNQFIKCFQVGFKTQFENYAGRFVGAAWAGSTVYVVGQTVRYVSILWVCTVAHTSTGSFDSSKFDTARRYHRSGSIIADNYFDECGYGVGFISQTSADGYNIYNTGACIKNNSFRKSVNSALTLDRLVNAEVTGNFVDGGEYGLFARDFSGVIANNQIRNTTKNGIIASLYSTTDIENNKLVDCGLGGVGDDSKAIVFIAAPSPVTGIPSQSANPSVYFINNRLSFTTGDAVGLYLVFDSDVRNKWTIKDTYGSTTTKKFRLDGGNSSVVYQYNNHFTANGYLNTVQNDVTYSVTNVTPNRTYDANTITTAQLASVVGTVIADQRSKFIIR